MTSTSVLVAEDDAAIRSLLNTVLSRAGFNVTLAEDGNVAIDRIAAEDFGAILLDLMMPVAGGFEVIRYMQENKAEALASCVIVITAAAGASLQELDESKVYRIIRKPFDLDALVDIVRECVSQRS